MKRILLLLMALTLVLSLSACRKEQLTSSYSEASIPTENEETVVSNISDVESENPLTSESTVSEVPDTSSSIKENTVSNQSANNQNSIKNNSSQNSNSSQAQSSSQVTSSQASASSEATISPSIYGSWSYCYGEGELPGRVDYYKLSFNEDMTGWAFYANCWGTDHLTQEKIDELDKNDTIITYNGKIYQYTQTDGWSFKYEINGDTVTIYHDGFVAEEGTFAATIRILNSNTIEVIEESEISSYLTVGNIFSKN